MSAIGNLLEAELAGEGKRRGNYDHAYGAAHRILQSSALTTVGFTNTPSVMALDQLANETATASSTHDDDTAGSGGRGNQPKNRPNSADIVPLAVGTQRELCAPLCELMKDMAFYSTMGLSTQVVVIEHNSPLSLAFIAAQESRVSSVLLFDESRGRFTGLITVTDFIHILLHCHKFPEAAEEIGKSTIAKVRAQSWRKYSGPSDLASGSAEGSLFAALDSMVRHRVSRLPMVVGGGRSAASPTASDSAALSSSLGGGDDTAAHRAVEAAMGRNQKAPTGASGSSDELFSVVSVLTFPQLLSHLARILLTSSALSSALSSSSPQPSPRSTSASKPQFNAAPSYSSVFEAPLGALSLGRNLYAAQRGEIPILRNSDTVATALFILLDKGVTSLAIQDDTGLIIDVMSRADVLRVESCGTFDISQTLQEALTFREAFRPVVCCPTDSFGDVMAHFVTTKVKEMFVVDPEDGTLIGQLGLREVLLYLHTMGTATGNEEG